MDGTLLDSMGMWQQLDRRFLRENGIEPPEDISEIVKSMTLETSSAYFVERFHLSMTPQQVSDRVEALAAEAYRRELPLKAGAKELLQALAARGIPCAVASVTYPALLEAALTRLDVRQYFCTVRTPAQGSAGKHTPELYQETARDMGALPAETVVIEDALYAAKTAADAGFYTIGFRDAASAADWQTLAQVCRRTVGSWNELHTDEFFGLFSASQKNF